jgi:hypothetical protein
MSIYTVEVPFQVLSGGLSEDDGTAIVVVPDDTDNCLRQGVLKEVQEVEDRVVVMDVQEVIDLVEILLRMAHEVQEAA